MSDAMIGPVAPPELHVMTYNIRRRMDPALGRPADRWRAREPRLRRLLRAERPSLLGTQEVMPSQLPALTEALGPAYRVIGHGRDRDGQGEGTPILYDAERLELVSWEQIALSNYPHLPGSRSWGNLVPRIAVCAEFRDRLTSAHFLTINTHFDHLSRRSQVRSAETLRRRVLSQSLPAIVMGDLNADADSLPVREMLRTDDLRDVWAAAARHASPLWGSFPNYGAVRWAAKRIDWIAVTPGIEVHEAGINARRFDGRWPSDHLPVQAVLRVPATGA